MLLKKSKDLKFRNKFLRYEKLNKINKFVFINLVSRVSKKKNPLITFFKVQFKLKRNSKLKIKTRCSLSNRGSSVFKSYALSRIKMREFMQFGVLPGYKKSIW